MTAVLITAGILAAFLALAATVAVARARARGRAEAAAWADRDQPDARGWYRDLREPGERLASPWGNGGPPWEPPERPGEITGSMLPADINPVPRARKPEPEPVPPGELAPWVADTLRYRADPEAALESIVRRAVTAERHAIAEGVAHAVEANARILRKKATS